ncbi:bridge-like lipid transfer protein family member 3A isoform X2 [Ictalurus furcatus]|uniref:bridge-like lipid transfer protein family member 3A isoform X2 n=1 Tax=Ictalurus furcatus TaxID=66913 RepID=UPI002350CF1E|nr:bridge-like lipid transfer protein family member 3A isoform X2 [Ictalurus furcatus]
MAGIIKKQILKHLSRFTKNLSPDKINLSTLKGEGQLSNLELDEEVLQNMLDLPTWLSISRVYCNKAAIRIQWTKLKTSPICLFLDKVEVEMMTCEEPRPPNGPSPIAITAGQSEYGFAEKVVEGMSVIINSIVIKMKSKAFHASFELWQLQGFSLNPKWQKSDLRYTRITHPKRGEVLTFKEIHWQSLRIEADAMESEEQDLGNTPLRLITNQGRIRIALKRRVKDCNVLASKLLFILDDLLWVLTDSQLKAVIHYAKSLSEAMEKSAKQRKNMETVPTSPGPRPPWPEPHPVPVATPNTLAQYFDLYDVKESSYHTFISRLDLHICNDSSASETDEPPIPGSQGAMQLTFRKLGFDYYPFHRPGDGCRHWERYCSALDSRTQWASKLLQDFQKKLESSGFPQPPSEPRDGESVTNADESLALKKLRSSCMVIRVDDLDIHQVSTRGRHGKKTQSLLSCNRKVLNMAENTPAIHLQFTEYYFPHHAAGPVPCSNLYGQLNGLQLCVDAASVLWMYVFCRGLLTTLEQVKAFYHLQDSSKSDEHVDVRVDATQLKLIIPLDSSILDHADRPHALSFTLSQGFLSNTHHSPHSSFSDLESTFSEFSAQPFFRASPVSPFPRDRNTLHPLPPAFLKSDPSLSLSRSSSLDVWSLSLSRAAGCFEGARRGGNAPPFMEPFAACVWMCRARALTKSLSQEGSLTNAENGAAKPSNHVAPSASIHFLVQSITPIRMWLSHYQYIALLRMKDYLARLASDLNRFPSAKSKTAAAAPPTVCVSLLLDALELGVLLPPVVGKTEEEEAPEETDTQSLTDSDLSPSRPDSGIVGSTEKARERQEDECDGAGEGPVDVEEACEAVEEGLDEGNGQGGESRVATSVVSPSPSPATVQNLNTSMVSLEGELSSALSMTKDVTKDAFSASLDLTKGALSITKDALSILSRSSAMSKIFSAQSKEPDDSALRLPPLRHSLSQNSCDSVVMDTSVADDGLSLDSDTSENFVILTDSESTRPNGTPIHSVRTDGGSLADLSSCLSHSTEDMSQDMVCVLLLSLRAVRSLMELHAQDAVVAMEVQSVTPKQLGNQRVVDLQTLTHGASSPPISPVSRPPEVCVRVEAGPGAGRHCCAAESAGFVEVCVRGCEAELLTSTINTLGPFMEDELNSDSQPIRITVHNTRITLRDDGPRVYPTAPQSVPVSFVLDGVVLERLDDTMLTVRPTASQSGDKACCGPEGDDKVQALQSELADVHSALSTAVSDRERLLQEIRKYDPSFTL